MEVNGKENLRSNLYHSVIISDNVITAIGEKEDDPKMSKEMENEFKNLSTEDKRKLVIEYFIDYNHIVFISKDEDKRKLYIVGIQDRILIVENYRDDEEKLLYNKYQNDRLNYLYNDHSEDLSLDLSFQNTSSYNKTGIHSNKEVSKYYLSCENDKLQEYEKDFIKEFLECTFKGKKVTLINKKNENYIVGNGKIVYIQNINKELINIVNKYNKKAIEVEKYNEEQMKLQLKMEGF